MVRDGSQHEKEVNDLLDFLQDRNNFVNPDSPNYGKLDPWIIKNGLKQLTYLLTRASQSYEDFTEKQIKLQEVSPRIVNDLCESSKNPGTKFYKVRQFLKDLKIHEGKAVWPSNSHKEKDKSQLVRSYDLALLVFHMNQQKGFRFEITEWA